MFTFHLLGCILYLFIFQKYICYADNGVTPSASKLHELHVNCEFLSCHYLVPRGKGLFVMENMKYLVPPMIHVKIPQSSVIMGKSGTLECEVEAFPRGATSWQTSEGKFITANSTKYQTSTYEYDFYRVCLLSPSTAIMTFYFHPTFFQFSFPMPLIGQNGSHGHSNRKGGLRNIFLHCQKCIWNCQGSSHAWG